MKRTFVLAFGIFLTIGSSITGLVIIPNWQFQSLKPVVKVDGTRYPSKGRPLTDRRSRIRGGPPGPGAGA